MVILKGGGRIFVRPLPYGVRKSWDRNHVNGFLSPILNLMKRICIYFILNLYPTDYEIATRIDNI